MLGSSYIETDFILWQQPYKFRKYVVFYPSSLQINI